VTKPRSTVCFQDESLTVALADPGQAQPDHVLGPFDEGAACEFGHLPLVQRRLEGEVEVLEALAEGQRGVAHEGEVHRAASS
jgi:hypothetical protein